MTAMRSSLRASRRWLLWLPAISLLAAVAAMADSPAPAGQSGASAASVKSARFKGIVQDDKLQPVSGATVTIVVVPPRDDADADRGEGIPDPGRRFDRMSMRERRERLPAVFFTAKTDASGAFTVEASGDGPFNLRIDAPGFAPTIVDAVAPGDAVSTLFLKRGARVSGVVADLGSGAPVPDAEVTARLQDDHGFSDPDDPARFARVVRTSGDGSFVLAGLPTGYHAIRVSAPGRAAFEAVDKPVADAPSGPLVLYLEPGFDVSGRVLDPSGKPATALDVHVRPMRRPGSILRFMTMGGLTSVAARTDKDGRFTLRGVPAQGTFTVDVRSKEFAPASVELPQSRGKAGVQGLEIRLEKGTSLRAKLIDADQKPVSASLRGTIVYRDPKTRRTLRTIERGPKEIVVSPQGDVSLQRLPSGLASITLSPEGYLEIARKDIRIGAEGKDTDLGTITLDRGKTIVGRVVDESEKPIAGARISARSFTAGSRRSATAKPDASGTFTLGGLAEGEWTVEASASGYATARREEIAPGGERIELRLARSGGLKGRVVAGDPPRPVPNFSVEVAPRQRGGGMGGLRNLVGGGGGGARNQTDPRGQLLVGNLSPGSYTLTVRAEGLQDLVRDGVEVRSGETSDVGEVALQAGGSLRGRVVSKQGEVPVPGAAVRVKSTALFDFRGMLAGRDESILTDLAGRFELRGLPAGPTTIVVEPSGYAKAELSGIIVEPGRPTEEVTVAVGKGGRIEGLVIGADGRPQANAIVTATMGMADFSARLSGTTDDQGHFGIDNVAPGTYRVTSLPFAGEEEEEDEGGGGGGARRFRGMDAVSAEVRDGETTTVNFGEKKIVVTGSVKRRIGEIAKQSVIFVPGGSGARMGAQIATTDEAGRYEVTLRRAGEYDVYIGDQGFRGGSAIKATIPDKPDVSYDLVIPEGTIAGRVSDEGDGKPLKGVSVVVTPEATAEDRAAQGRRRAGSRATTDETGAYQVDGLTAGRYDVAFSAQGYGIERISGIEVKGGEEATTIDQLLSPGLPFTVRVTSPTGSSVNGATVMVAQDGSILQGAGGATREDGSLEMKQLKAGVYSFVALTRDYAPTIASGVSIGGEEDADSALITLSSGGTARIIVQDYGKKPVSGAEISIEGEGGRELDEAIRIMTALRGGRTTTSADGVVTLEHLPTGKYQVTATLADKKIVKSIAIPDGGNADLTITLQ